MLLWASFLQRSLVGQCSSKIVAAHSQTTMTPSDIWWLVLGTISGTVTSAVLHCMGHMFSTLKLTIQQFTFQYLANRFDLSKHTFKSMSNTATIPRLLEQIDLRTYEYMWLHEANAAANDSVQHGYIRLPTKSAMCKLLAFCHISHFIWISSDLQTIYIVGPSVCVTSLVQMSNQAATRRMNAHEIQLLKTAFGCDGYVTDVEASFIRYERYTLLALTVIAMLFSFVVPQMLPILISLLLLCCTICHTWSVLASCSLKKLAVSMWNKLRFNRGVRHLVHVELYDPLIESRYELGIIEGQGEEDGSTTGTASMEQSATRTEDAVISEMNGVTVSIEGSNSKTYSLVLSIEYYYAVMQQNSIAAWRRGQISTSNAVAMYAVTECKNFSDCVASMVLSDSLVYVCVYNPMTDPPLFMLRDLISNGQKDSPIFLAIILPPMEFLERALKEHCEFRVRTQRCSQFVATVSDFEDLLMKASTGFLSQELAFVIPIAFGITDEELESKHIWKSARALLGDENCHRIEAQSDVA